MNEHTVRFSIVYYPPRGVMPGHIALKSYWHDDRGEKVERFHDWGGTHNERPNIDEYGEPIIIKLPEAPKRLLISLTSDDYVPGEYNLLKNNCAHAVQTLLFHAGYIKSEPDKRFALLPKTVARQAARIALEDIKQHRQEITSGSISFKNNKNKIEILLTLTRFHMRAEMQLEQITNPALDTRKQTKQQQGLDVIANSFSRAKSITVELVQKLLNFQNQYPEDDRLQSEISQCLQLLPIQFRAQIKTYQLVSEFQQKCKKAGLTPEQQQRADELVATLKTESVKLSSQSSVNPETLSKAQENAIKAFNNANLEAVPTLKTILNDILRHIMTLFGLGSQINRYLQTRASLFNTHQPENVPEPQDAAQDAPAAP